MESQKQFIVASQELCDYLQSLLHLIDYLVFIDFGGTEQLRTDHVLLDDVSYLLLTSLLDNHVPNLFLLFMSL
jgi:hypothetical protein